MLVGNPVRFRSLQSCRMSCDVSAVEYSTQDKPDEARSVLNQILGTHFDPPVGPGAGRCVCQAAHYSLVQAAQHAVCATMLALQKRSNGRD